MPAVVALQAVVSRDAFAGPIMRAPAASLVSAVSFPAAGQLPPTSACEADSAAAGAGAADPPLKYTPDGMSAPILTARPR